MAGIKPHLKYMGWDDWCGPAGAGWRRVMRVKYIWRPLYWFPDTGFIYF